jgi:hypothetical protein
MLLALKSYRNMQVFKIKIVSDKAVAGANLKYVTL